MENYLPGVIKQFEYYKGLGEAAMHQLPDEALFWRYNEDCNSIAVIVQHMAGNMLSRFTDFLTSDGEKSWRNGDAEFEDTIINREELMEQWTRGWNCLLNVLRGLRESELDEIIYIRNEGHTVMEAINRQLAHYPYHIGQIVFIAKMALGEKFKSLSIPRNKSAEFNAGKFSKEKGRRHFTDEK